MSDQSIRMSHKKVDAVASPRGRKQVPRVVGLAFILSLAGCDGSLPGASLVGGPSWTVTEEVDPINDQRVQRATATVSGQMLNAETTIACTDDRITYTLSTFDRSGEPLPMRPDGGYFRPVLRFDSRPPRYLTSDARISNQITFFDGSDLLPAAAALTLRLPLNGAEETLVIDQSDSRLRAMLNQCANTLGARSRRIAAESARIEAERYARCGDHPCPIDPPPLVPETPLGLTPVEPIPSEPREDATEAPVADADGSKPEMASNE